LAAAWLLAVGGTGQAALLKPVLLAWLAFGLAGRGRWSTRWLSVATWRDGIIVLALALAADPGATLWAVPASLASVFSLTQGSTALIGGVFLFASLRARWLRNTPLSPASALAFLLLPIGFNLLLLLGNGQLLGAWGSVFLGDETSLAIRAALGRALLLSGLNLGAFWGMGMLLDGRGTRDPRLLLLVILCGIWAAWTPLLADWGSSATIAELDPAFGLAGIVGLAALAQGGLWAQTFLLTGLLMEGLRGQRPRWATAWAQSHEGASKGAVYGALFMLILGLSVMFLKAAAFKQFMQTAPLVAGMVLGPLLFGLARTLVESFDGSAPFVWRLRNNLKTPRNYARGIVLGLGLALALDRNIGASPELSRFAWGFIIGAAAGAGVDLAADAWQLLRGVRRHLDTGRTYVFASLLGGGVGGLLAWYFDALQLQIVGEKLMRYALIHGPSAGQPVYDYVTYPLFSRWGAIDLGTVSGGLKQFYCDSLAGVINWSIAAPLFSINLIVLTAVFQRSLEPLRHLFSRDGLAGVVTQAVRVQRWGLWMAPIIQTFLKMAPNPAWYNQDGALRTGLATVQSLRLDDAAFRRWSLETFLGLMAYGWLRILIWFDHMGLRVATLVNLSFIGVDRLEARLARWLGHASPTPVIPEGIRRFATWAPLLLPFYIPRGAEWDFVWQESQRLAASPDAPLLPAARLLLGVYIAAGIGGFFLLIWLLRRLHRTRQASVPVLARLHSGRYQLEIAADGNSHSLVHMKSGDDLDFSRRNPDPSLPHGRMFYLQESLPATGAFSPPVDLLRAGPMGTRTAQRTPAGTVVVTQNGGADGLNARIEVRPFAHGEAMLWRIHLSQSAGRARRLRITSYLEWALNRPDVYLRRPDFNAIHIGVRFVRDRAALLAHNRLLGGEHPKRHPPGCAFVAVKPNDRVRLVGYEDDRSRFLGLGTLAAPQGLVDQALRGIGDEGLLYPFDPAAVLQVEVDLAPEDTVELAWIEGWADSEAAALAAITRAFPSDIPSPSLQTMKKIPPRGILPRPGLDPRFGFTLDGRGFAMGPDTPRPWTHVLANRQGHGVLIGNDGAQFSFSGNAQQNGLTPFTLDTVPAQSCAQAVYVTDLETGALVTPGFIPLRQNAAQEVRFEPGQAVLASAGADLALCMTVAVLPDEPVEVRVLRVENRSAHPRKLRLTAFAHLSLAELPQDSHGQILTHFDSELRACLFSRPRQVFHAGMGFLAIDLPVEAHSFNRRAFWGAAGDFTRPAMALTGCPQNDELPDGETIAALSGVFRLAPFAAQELVVLMGQAKTADDAARLIRRYGQPAPAAQSLIRTRDEWTDILGQLRIETDHPDFDRLVNDWLPYQVLTARLWGRLGPNQRSGAFGFRDQLQDVLPLIWTWPELAREQILRHAAVQFPEGDVLKWWHPATDGGIGLGQRSRASDPHLWLPYLVSHYVTATGDWDVLETQVPYLEGRPIPKGWPDIAFVPRVSREQENLYRHCRRAIAFSLAHLSPRGLPRMGAGDWNDGLDQLGLKGRGESVWMALLLHDVLRRFAPLTRRVEGVQGEQRDLEAARRLRAAIDACWLGDRFLRATSDRGEPFAPLSALMASWPAISGATDAARAEAALTAGLAGLEQPNLIRLLDEVFDGDSKPYPGRIALYPPGVRENGGQYAHGATWLVDAALTVSAQAGSAGDSPRADHWHRRAWSLWQKLSPMNKDPVRYGLPPYQQAADVYWGAGHDGRGGWTGYTGAAARMLWTAYGLLGLRLEHGEFTIDPAAFTRVGAPRLRTVRYRGRLYRSSRAVSPGSDRMPDNRHSGEV
jgi:cyclic beta-1,2-glucan synthetase